MNSQTLQAQHVKKIHAYLQSQYVHYLDVQLELVDHIAAAIERRMTSEELTFDNAYRLEIKKWTWQDLDAIIEKKRKSLNRFWNKKMYSYVLSFLTFPKIATLLLIYGLLVGVVFTFVLIDVFVLYAVASLGIMFMIAFGCGGYYMYALDSYQEQYLAVESYRKGMYSIYSLFFVGYIIMQEFPIVEFTDVEKVFFLSVLIVLAGALFYATWFVFPKWLRRDVFEQYAHLLISN